MARKASNERAEMEELLLAALNFKSGELRLVLERKPELAVPTPLVKAEAAVLDLPPLTGEKLDALFRSIASLDQRRELRREGRVRFIHVFEAMNSGRPVVGGFRIEAKAVNGRVVLLTCHNLRRYKERPGSSASAQPA